VRAGVLPVSVGNSLADYLRDLSLELNSFWATVLVYTLEFQFTAVGSRYGITSFSISPHIIRLEIWDSFASSLMLAHDNNSV